MFQALSSHPRLVAALSATQTGTIAVIVESSRRIYGKTKLSLAVLPAFPKITQVCHPASPLGMRKGRNEGEVGMRKKHEP